MRRPPELICLIMSMMLVAGSLVSQVGQREDLLRQILQSTVASWDRATGKSFEMKDSLHISEGSQVQKHLMIRTKVYRKMDRVYYELRELHHDPSKEAPILMTHEGLSDRTGKPRWKVDGGDWTYRLLHKYYHPDARFLISRASVNEGYRPEQLAVLDPQGIVVFMVPMPQVLLTHLDGSVLACFYREDGPAEAVHWRIRYRDLNTDQEWDKHFHGFEPKPFMVHSGDKGILYTREDTLFYLNSGGQPGWKTTIKGLSSSWLHSMDGESYQLLDQGGMLKLLGTQAKEVMYSYQFDKKEALLLRGLKGIQGSGYSYRVSAIGPGTYGLRFYDERLNLLDEMMVESPGSASVAAYYLKNEGKVEWYLADLLFRQWKE